MATYLPTASLTPVYNLIAFSSTVSALETALRAAFPTEAVQCEADDAHAGNALVIARSTVAFTVPAGNYVGFNLGTWGQYTPAQVAGGPNSLFTAYTP